MRRGVDVGAALVARADAAGAGSLAIVGNAKHAGKTVAFDAILEALARAGRPHAALSIGRDGERTDATTDAAKPPVRLGADVVFVTARALVPRHPAVEILALTRERGAAGPLVVARTRRPVAVELAGAVSADALRRLARLVARTLAHAGDRFVAIDGAIDRLAALRDGDDAIVVAIGTTGARDVAAAADGARALVRRLTLPTVDEAGEALAIEGALTREAALAHVAAGERRQIVVADPTRVAFGGRAFLDVVERLDLRVRRALRPVACTVAPDGPEGRLDGASLRDAVARATGLPTYDVFAAALAEARA